jgi:AcrR family transcriptional regulator
MARKLKGSTTRAETEETSHIILRTAGQLFMQYGYRAVSTRQIADACGLTQPALYHYFADKQTLYVEVIKDNTGKTHVALDRIVKRNESVQERLRLIVRYLLSTTQHNHGLMLHDIQYELDDAKKELLNNLFQTYLISPIAAVFEEGIQQGLLCAPQQGGLDATSAAYTFMNMLSRFLLRPEAPIGHSGRYGGDVEHAEIIVQILLYGLVKRNSEGVR